jgi:Tfp pilus assembly protein PilF
MKTICNFKALLLILLAFAIGCTPAAVSLKKQKMALTARDLGEKIMLDGDFPRAIKELNRATKLNPNDPVTHNYLGLSYRASAKNTHNSTSKNNFLNLAVKHYKMALDLDPDYSIARNNLGNVYIDQKKWDDAIDCYKEVTKDLEYTPPYYPLSNLGWAYYNKKEYDTAEKYYLDALNLEPKFLLAMLGLGRTYLSMGKTSDALGVLEKTAEVYPKTPEVYLDLANAYKASKNNQKALDAYRKVIQLAPKTVLAFKANKEINKLSR